MEFLDPRKPHPPLLTGLLLILIGGLVYVMRDSLSPVAAAFCGGVALWCAWRGMPALATAGLVIAGLVASWAMDGIVEVTRPLVIGAVAAYLFGPLVRRLEVPLGGRTAAILVVMVGILLLIAGIGVAVIPRLLWEVAGLIHRLPDYTLRMKEWYSAIMAWSAQFGVGDRLEALQRRALEDLPGLGQAALEYLAGRLLGWVTRAAALLDLLIAPFVAFYLLKDGARIGGGISRLIPLRHRGGCVALVVKVDEVLGEYVRGQAIVCGIVAALTSVGLAVAGIPYALLLGCAAGLLNVVPYVGLLTTLGMASVVAMFDPNPGFALVKVLAVFAAVQGLEGNLITPKIVGERVGLHPLWVILAVTLFSHAWGVLGMVTAVPAAAVINILVRAGAGAYYQSEFYTRESRRKDGEEEP